MNEARDMTDMQPLRPKRTTIDLPLHLLHTVPTEYRTYHRLRKSFIVLLAAIGVMLGGAGVWILNTLSILQGSWSGIMGILFTACGTLLTIIQLYAQFVPPTAVTQGVLPSYHIPMRINKRKGGLLVKVKKQFRGTTLILSDGFDQIKHQHELAANVVEYVIGSQRVCIGVFPSITPGNYLVSTTEGKYVAKVTIYAEHVSEIDWR